MIDRLIKATITLVMFLVSAVCLAWLSFGSFGIIVCAFAVSPWCLFAFLLHPAALAVFEWSCETCWEWR